MCEEDEREKLQLMFIPDRVPQHEAGRCRFGTWQMSCLRLFVYRLYLFFKKFSSPSVLLIESKFR
jgi:hypothetical protein